MSEVTEANNKSDGTSGNGTIKQEATYVVLRKLDDTGATNLRGWAELETVVARNAEAAIRDVAGRHEENDVTYVAIPSKSWKPRNVYRRERIQMVIG